MKCGKLLLICIVSYSNTLLAQPRFETVNNSALVGVTLSSEADRDQEIFYIAEAKTTFEIEASNYQVNISDVEFLTCINSTGIKEVAKKWIEGVKQSLKNNQYDIFPSKRDPSFFWLSKNGMNSLIYASAGKKEADIYFGIADKLPEAFGNSLKTQANTRTHSSIHSDTPSSVQTCQKTAILKPVNTTVDPGKMQPNLVGNWSNLTGARVNWRDESAGNLLVSRVSKGYGMELKPDGTFLHTTVVTSGRPIYRVFVSTIGNWTENGNQLILTPLDRHYRKWENEIIMIDEHSVPESYTLFWMLKVNQITGKECLYIKYDMQQEQWDELCKE